MNVHEALTAQFLRWELRGRGWQLFDEPVALEPSFRPFTGHYLPQRRQADVEAEGRLGSPISNLLRRLRRAYSPTEEEISASSEDSDDEEEPELVLWERDSVVELQVSLPKDGRFERERMESFLLMVSGCSDPLAFEIIATGSEIVIQFAASAADSILLRGQLEAHFPDFVIGEQISALHDKGSDLDKPVVAAEFALGREFMLPLCVPKSDPFVGILAAMSAVVEGELLFYQVLFEPVRHPWAASALFAVADSEGGPFFRNRPELLAEARLKMQRPLYAVTLRVAASGLSTERAWHLLSQVATSLSAFERAGGNYLFPLASARNDPETLEGDLLYRQSHRSGMLLNIDELLALAHFPDASAHQSKLRVDTGRTKAAPQSASEGGLFLGWNEHAGMRHTVCLTLEERVRHMHIVGASGTGKSTLLLNLIAADIAGGQGLTVIDPHGDLIDHALALIPPERVNDVVLIDPADEEFSIGFNVLAAEGDLEKNLLASDLVSIFERLSTSWGDQMASVLNYAILAFLESSEGGTLADLQRFLLEPDFRTRFLSTVQDEHVSYYWKKGFTQLGGGKSIGPITTRLGLFLSPKPIRYMVTQRENRLKFGDLMASGKIILARLPQGRMGRENSFLLGSLLVSKIQQAAMARQRIPESARRLHTLYVDEFQNFCTPSMAEILSGARKYRVALVLAHQSLDQIKRHDEVGGAVLGNAGTRVVFRVGDTDARELERGFEHFEAKALKSLPTGHAIVRIERSDADFNLTVPLPSSLDPADAARSRTAATEASRRNFGTSRSAIEAEFVAARERDSQEAAPEMEERKGKAKPAAGPTQSTVLEDEPKPEVSPPSPPPQPVAPPSPPPGADPEVQKPTPPLPPAVSPYTPTAIRPTVEALGRGGQDHRAAQLELKSVAESLGFLAATESRPEGSKASADLYLKRDGIAIACEITVTNVLSAELEKVRHHLKVPGIRVAVICLDPEKRAKFQAAIENALPSELASRVTVQMKEEFVASLQVALMERPPEKPEKKTPKKEKGWKVTTTTVEVSEEEMRQRDNEIAAMLAASMSRKRVRKKKAES